MGLKKTRPLEIEQKVGIHPFLRKTMRNYVCTHESQITFITDKVEKIEEMVDKFFKF